MDAANAIQGSHRVDVMGDRVVIRDLGLFCGFHPDFDAKGSRAEKYDRSRIDSIVENTRKRMSIGQYPQVIERHTGKPGARSESFGRIVAVRADHTDRTSYVRGDVEMSRSEFDARIKSNRWCRRSAQVWPDDHFSEVALLGNETPARPLEDTHFEHEGEPLELAAEGPVSFDLSSSPAVPELISPKGKSRKAKTMDEDTDKAVAQKDAVIGDLTRQRDDFAKANEALRGDFDRQKAAWEADRTDLQRRLEAVESDARRLDCEKIIGELERDGFAFGGDVRQQMFDRLIAAPDRAKETSWIRQIGRKVPLNEAGRIDTTHARVGAPAKLDAATVEQFQKQANGDPAKYAELVDRFMKG